MAPRNQAHGRRPQPVQSPVRKLHKLVVKVCKVDIKPRTLGVNEGGEIGAEATTRLPALRPGRRLPGETLLRTTPDFGVPSSSSRIRRRGQAGTV